ncbi:serine hydrolase [Polaribacter porphyrae]|uniref:Beta-lactamase-related domain-containing protein n=1 Tax=Polaribacter porphyrae TaxID=1137780 RepID=A0A2S7WR87_9FLAO|nr:serine hydrolase [Polaribacter porphyrae]PQJ80104.1 hypothetical protein BTO18_13380 [Polaribacter porphyrae]
MKSITQCFTIYLLFISFFSCKKNEIQSTNSKVEKYKDFVAKMHQKGFTTGNILVYENEKIIFQSANGLRSIDPVDSLTLDSQFRLASISKQFTGISIAKLKIAGKITYNQKVNTILKDFLYDNITIKHLLHHTSGLADYEAIIEENFEPKDSEKRYILGNNEILEVYYKVNPKLNFEPGEQWEYSNTGYMVLASIVEKVSGKHFSIFLKENIFDPLEMNNSTLYNYQEKRDPNMPNRVFGYSTAFNQKDLYLYDYDIVNDVRGDGGIYSTLHDLYKWNLAISNYKVLPKKELKEAWSWGSLNDGTKTRYGFGFKFLKDKKMPKTVFHAGEWVAFGTFLLNEYETKSGYIVLTNNNTPNHIAITDAIDSIRADKPYSLPKKSIAESFAGLMYSENLAKAMQFLDNNKNDSEHYFIDENHLNYLGSVLARNKNIDEALTVFKLNIERFPNSANVYDSYGEALLIKGDSLSALKYFKTAYKMDKSFENTRRTILKIEKALKN